jgi:hypothetical protein
MLVNQGQALTQARRVAYEPGPVALGARPLVLGPRCLGAAWALPGRCLGAAWALPEKCYLFAVSLISRS